MFTPRAAYEFRHPLIRTVAYDSQLKSSRADLHRRLATAIELNDPAAADENAALIANHLQAAGDLTAAYDWHMRAGAWSSFRDLAAATTSWRNALEVADQLSADDPNRSAMRIAPRTLLCGNSWRIGGTVADTGFDELRELTDAAGDKVSLAIGMMGWITALTFNDRIAESALLADEFVTLVESIGDPALIVGLLPGAVQAKAQAGDALDTRRLAGRISRTRRRRRHDGHPGRRITPDSRPRCSEASPRCFGGNPASSTTSTAALCRRAPGRCDLLRECGDVQELCGRSRRVRA